MKCTARKVIFGSENWAPGFPSSMEKKIRSHVLHIFGPHRNPVAASDVNFQLTIVNTLLDRLGGNEIVHESGWMMVIKWDFSPPTVGLIGQWIIIFFSDERMEMPGLIANRGQQTKPFPKNRWFLVQPMAVCRSTRPRVGPKNAVAELLMAVMIIWKIRKENHLTDLRTEVMNESSFL